MLIKEYFVKRTAGTSDPVALSVMTVSPDDPADIRFTVQIIHGLFDRKERWMPFMTAVTEAGGMAVIHDLRGYGNTVRSNEELGSSSDFGYSYEILRGDIDAVYASVSCHPADGELVECDFDPETDTPDMPRFLLGFSSGALMTAIYLAGHTSSAAGAVLSSLPKRGPMISLRKFFAGAVTAFIGENARPRGMNRRLHEKYSRGFVGPADHEPKLAWYSTDPFNRAELNADDLCGHSKTTGFYENLCRLTRDVYRPASYNRPRKNLPLLITAGEFDPESGGDKRVLSSAKFFADMEFGPVDIKMYRGMRHELFRDIGRENVFADVIDFFLKNLDSENARLGKIRGEYENVFSVSDERQE